MFLYDFKWSNVKKIIQTNKAKENKKRNRKSLAYSKL
jgi:hypothetical protein